MSRRTRRQQLGYPVTLQSGEGIGDFFKSVGRKANNVNKGLKQARIAGRTDDFLRRTNLRDPVRTAIANQGPWGNRLLQGADLAIKHGHGAQNGGCQNGNGFIGDLLQGASTLIPVIGPAISPAVGSLADSIGLGKTGKSGGRRRKPGPKKGSHNKKKGGRKGS